MDDPGTAEAAPRMPLWLAYLFVAHAVVAVYFPAYRDPLRTG